LFGHSCSGIFLFSQWKVRVRRLAKVGRLAVIAAAAFALSMPTTSAIADETLPPTAGDPVAVEPDPAIPAGDEGNDPAADKSAQRKVRIAVETAHAFGTPESKDRFGFETSLYQGKWFMPAKEGIRKCLSKLESHHNYKAGAGRYYKGAYQFSKPLAQGVTWTMQREVKKEMGSAAVDLVQKLRKTPMNQWNRYWQDRAFWTVWRNGNGKHHWNAGRGRCF